MVEDFTEERSQHFIEIQPTYQTRPILQRASLHTFSNYSGTLSLRERGKSGHYEGSHVTNSELPEQSAQRCMRIS